MMNNRKWMEPPWKKSHFPLYSLGWRMGSGEYYRLEWRSWFTQLSPEKQQAYMARYPEPEDWFEFYHLTLASNEPETKAAMQQAETRREAFITRHNELSVACEHAGKRAEAIAHLEQVILYKSPWLVEAVSRYAALRRDLAQEMAETERFRRHWKTLEQSENSRELAYHRSFSAQEYTYIQQGFIPPRSPGYEPGWEMYMEHETLYIHKSWEKPCYFLVKFGHDKQDYRVQQAWRSCPRPLSEDEREFEESLLDDIFDTT